MSVLIDPYMFELSDAQEISNNISFFWDMIKLCTHSNKSQRVSIVIYKGLIDKMNQRSIQPFPIKMQMIEDRDLKETIMQINNAFNNALLKSIESIDIDECSGNQEFEVTDDEMLDDEKYYEMLCTLLIPCYLKQINIDNRILTGKKADGKQIGDKFHIKCSCPEQLYRKEFFFTGIDDFISVKKKVIESLREKRKNGEIPIVVSVPAEMGEHHNHVQANGKKFKTLNDLSIRNKMVLKLLQELGLFKIIFERFTSKGVKAIGTMNIHSVDKKNTQDIVTVKFNAETEFQLITELYFPKDVGQLLHNYFLTEQLTYKNVSDLVEKIK